MTLSDARYLKVGWNLVKGIVNRQLARTADKHQWKDLRRVAIDEIAVKRGHPHSVVVLDLETGRVVYVEKGRDHEALEGFFRNWPEPALCWGRTPSTSTPTRTST